MKSAGESDSQESSAESETPGAAAGKSVAIGCLVLAGAVLALGIVIGAVLTVTSVVRNPADEPERLEINGQVLNRCEMPIRAGWVLSDTATPFTSDDAGKFFPPRRVRTEDAESPVTENQTRIIAPGTSASIGLGRPESAMRERILLIQVFSLEGQTPDIPVKTGDAVLAYSLKPASLDVTGGAVLLVVSGKNCIPENLEPVSLG